ncbi:hypothetical protein [Acidiphilium sp.]|uniref:hypothetical protein n=1 Tax=Acidiphilium sp. TaxID=527 RepID=UPI003D044852
MAVEISLLLAVHLAGFAGWTGCLGGFLLLGTVATPLLRACLFAMPITLASGWALGFLQFGQPGAWPWAVNAMQTAGIAMAVVLLIAWFGARLLLRDGEASGDAAVIDAATRRLTRLIAVDLLLGGMSLGFAVLGRFG